MRQRVPFACLGLAPQGCDGVEQPAPMADEGNAEVLEVVGGQIGQEIDVDLVVAERLLVALEPEAAQPIPDVIHHATLAIAGV